MPAVGTVSLNGQEYRYVLSAGRFRRAEKELKTNILNIPTRTLSDEEQVGWELFKMPDDPIDATAVLLYVGLQDHFPGLTLNRLYDLIDFDNVKELSAQVGKVLGFFIQTIAAVGTRAEAEMPGEAPTSSGTTSSDVQ